MRLLAEKRKKPFKSPPAKRGGPLSPILPAVDDPFATTATDPFGAAPSLIGRQRPADLPEDVPPSPAAQSLTERDPYESSMRRMQFGVPGEPRPQKGTYSLEAVREARLVGKDPTTWEETQILTAGMIVIGIQALLEGMEGSGLAEFKTARAEGANFDRAILRGYRAQDLPSWSAEVTPGFDIPLPWGGKLDEIDFGVKGALELIGPEDILPGGLILGASLGVGKLSTKAISRLARLHSIDEVADAVGIDKAAFREMVERGERIPAGGSPDDPDAWMPDWAKKEIDEYSDTLADLDKTPKVDEVTESVEKKVSANTGKAGTADAVFYRIEDTQEIRGPLKLAEAEEAARELAEQGYKVGIYPSMAARSRLQPIGIDMSSGPGRTFLPTTAPRKPKVDAKAKRGKKTLDDIQAEYAENQNNFLLERISADEYAKRENKIIAAFKRAGGEEISLEPLADRMKRGVPPQPETAAAAAEAVAKKTPKATKPEVDKVLEETNKLLAQGYSISKIDLENVQLILTKPGKKDKVIKTKEAILKVLAKKQKGISPTPDAKPGAAPTADPLAAAKAAGAADAAREAARAVTPTPPPTAAGRIEPEMAPPGRTPQEIGEVETPAPGAAPTGRRPAGRGLERGRAATRARAAASAREAKPAADAAAVAATAARKKAAIKASAAKSAVDRVNLDKFDEETRGVLKELLGTDAVIDAIQIAQRGHISVDATQQMARDIAEKELGLKITKDWKPGTAYNAEELTAIRMLLAGSAHKMAAMARDMAMPGDITPRQTADALLGIMQIKHSLNLFAGGASESGRALRSLREEIQNIGKGLTDDQLWNLAVRFGFKKKKSFDQILAIFAQHGDASDPTAVYRLMRDFDKPGFGDYIAAFFINGILSSPKTQIINLMGNLSAFAARIPEQTVAIGIEKVAATVTRRQATRYWDEVPAAQVGALYGLRAGIPAAFKILKFGIPSISASKLEYRLNTFPVYAENKAKRYAARAMSLPTQMLETIDTFNFTLALNSKLAELATNRARRAGLKGDAVRKRVAAILENPADEPDLMKEATEAANYLLFRNEDAFSNKIIAVREHGTLMGLPFGRILVPFVRTPTNLLKFGIARSPVGLLKFLPPDKWKKLAAGEPGVADELARTVLGSMAATGIYFAFIDGKITTAAPMNPGERDRFYREGKLPYAIKMGSTWIQYQRLEPFNQVFSQIGAVANFMEKGEDESAAEAAGLAIMSMAENLTSQTFMNGVSDLLEVLNSGDETYKMVRWLRKMAGSMVPYSSLLRTTAQATDPTFRTIDQTFWQAWQYGMPGMTDELEPQLNAFGEESVRPGSWWLPIQYSPDAVSTIDVELENTGVEIGRVSRKLGDIELSPAWRTEYQRLSGCGITEALGAVVAHPMYQRQDTETRTVILEGTVRRARDVARAVLKMRMAQDGDIAPSSVDPPCEAAGKTTEPPAALPPATTGVPTGTKTPTRTGSDLMNLQQAR